MLDAFHIMSQHAIVTVERDVERSGNIQRGQIEDMEQFFGGVLQQMPLTPEGKAPESADKDIDDEEVTAHLDMEPGEMEDEEEQED